MSILVRNGSPTIKRIEVSETFPDIRDAIIRNSLPRPSFSSVPLRNEDVVPVAKALRPRDIQIEPSENIQKSPAMRYNIDDNMISIFAIMSVFFCQ